MSDALIAAGTPVAPVTTPAVPTVVGTTTGESFMQGGESAPKPPAATGGAVTPSAASSAPVAGQPGAKAPPRLALTNEEMRDRLSRAKASALKDVFGTDNPAAIKDRLAKLEALEKKAEADRLAQMSEIERAKHEATRARAEALRYRSELVQAQEREVVRDQTAFVERIASQHVNPAALEEASLAFARAVATTDPKVVARWSEKDVATWFRQYVAKKPFMAATAGQPARRVERAPAGSAQPPPRPRQPATAATASSSKTFRPGQPNSMSRAEAREEAKRRGFSW